VLKIRVVLPIFNDYLECVAATDRSINIGAIHGSTFAPAGPLQVHPGEAVTSHMTFVYIFKHTHKKMAAFMTLSGNH